jgi:hypothetical protein
VICKGFEVILDGSNLFKQLDKEGNFCDIRDVYRGGGLAWAPYPMVVGCQVLLLGELQSGWTW